MRTVPFMSPLDISAETIFDRKSSSFFLACLTLDLFGIELFIVSHSFSNLTILRLMTVASDGPFLFIVTGTLKQPEAKPKGYPSYVHSG